MVHVHVFYPGGVALSETLSILESGQWLVAHLAETEQREAAWLDVLAEFDTAQGWAADGQLSCAEWLTWKGRMGRATAYEKLMVAHQLRRRPQLRQAFADGRVSYSAARAMARMDDPDPEVDQALIELAQAGTVKDVERMVALYRRHADQHRRPEEALARRSVRLRPGLDGTTTVEITLSDLEAEELMTCVQAFVDQQLAAETDQTRAPAADESAGPAGDESARADWPTPWSSRQADAVMDMIRTALAHARDGQAAGDDRYLVHLVSTSDGMQTLDGQPIDADTAARIACDASSVTHLLGPGWEPLALGRKTREWNTAQRRAIIVRDGGQCRFVGCYRTSCDIHHHHWWEDGGPTDVCNGFLSCDRHHTLLHAGFYATGNPNGELTFHRANGTVIGTTRRGSPR